LQFGGTYGDDAVETYGSGWEGQGQEGASGEGGKQGKDRIAKIIEERVDVERRVEDRVQA
jgi:hypothetical protein